MKKLKFVHSEDVREWVGSLWRFELFKASHEQEGGYIAGVVDAPAKKPLVAFEMTDSKLEWSHFTTWMGCIALREYESDVVHDLYYLHEFVHMGTMTYDSTLSFAKWFRKMTENEMYASLHSEAFVYFMLDGLREQSFEFELWVDRFQEKQREFKYMPTLEMMDSVTEATVTARASGLYDDNQPPMCPEALGTFAVETDLSNLLHRLMHERVQTMRNPSPFDLCALQIHYYAQQNVQWANVWSRRWREVEKHMEEMDLLATNRSYDRKKFEDAKLSFLLSTQSRPTRRHEAFIPYEEEAEAFATIVEANKVRQGNQLFTS